MFSMTDYGTFYQGFAFSIGAPEAQGINVLLAPRLGARKDSGWSIPERAKVETGFIV